MSHRWREAGSSVRDVRLNLPRNRWEKRMKLWWSWRGGGYKEESRLSEGLVNRVLERRRSETPCATWLPLPWAFFFSLTAEREKEEEVEKNGEERLIANRTTTRQFNLIYTSGRFRGFSFIVMGQIWAFKCILISDSNLVIGLRFTIRNSRDFFLI